MTILVGGSAAGQPVGSLILHPRSVDLGPDFLLMRNANYLWTAFPTLDSALGTNTPAIQIMAPFVTNIISATPNLAGNKGAFHVISGRHLFPRTTAGLISNNANSTHTGVSQSNDTNLAASVSRLESHPTLAQAMAIQNVNISTISTSVHATAQVWVTKTLNTDAAPFPVSARIKASTFGGSRFYVAGFSGTSWHIAYSPVNDVSGSYTDWPVGNITPASSSIQVGSFAANDTNPEAWLISLGPNNASDAGKIWRATTLGGAFTQVFAQNLSGQTSLFYYLSYDSDTSVFLAIPSIAGFPMQASSDNGATWVAGDNTEFIPQHEAIKFDDTNDFWVLPWRTDDKMYAFIRLGSNGAPKVTEGYAAESVNTPLNNPGSNGTMLNIVKNTNVVTGFVGINAARNMTETTNLSTQFYLNTMFGTIDTDLKTNAAIPNSMSYSMKVK